MTVLIPNLAIAGYRSFGKAPQYFDKFAKINLLIGRNNAGKSNVIRFLSEIYPQAAGNNHVTFDALARHLPTSPPLLVGGGFDPEEADFDAGTPNQGLPQTRGIQHASQRRVADNLLRRIFKAKCQLDGSRICWSLQSLPERRYQEDTWLRAMQTVHDNDLELLWNWLTHATGGSRKGHWEPDVARRLPQPLPSVKVQVIPAIRQIGSKGSYSDGFDGNGIIERLAKLQNPDVHSQTSRERFAQITSFLQVVIGDPEATIEIPYERDTILVHMDGKVLPIESLGSGIHEVIILAAAATVLEDHVVCIEEPELHLNPVLQRKLIRYLAEFTTNQYFMSTHSAALMDNEGLEIYHIKLEQNASIVERVTSDHQRSLVCEDLGYHPSDLLQANCVIWVEGPSDRIYLKYWLHSVASEVVEGIHYSIMFYGGRLASHLSNEDYSNEIDEFISLRRLNRRGVIVLDSDRQRPHSKINETKRRLQKEFDSGPGHAWITNGREIENYIPADQIKDAIAAVCPTATLRTAIEKHDNCLSIRSRKGRESQAPKVEIAKYITNTFQPDLSILDLRQRIDNLLLFIQESNPQPPHC